MQTCDSTFVVKVLLCAGILFPVQVGGQSVDACSLGDLQVRVQKATALSARGLRVNAVATHGSVSPPGVGFLAEFSYSCRSGGNVGVVSNVTKTEDGRYQFTCDVETSALCADVFVEVVAGIPDTQLARGCAESARAVVNSCMLVDASPSSRTCVIDDFTWAPPAVARASGSLHDFHVTLRGRFARAGRLEEDNSQTVEERIYCSFGGTAGRIAPVRKSAMDFQFNCTVWAQFPFDCEGNTLSYGMELYATSSSGAPVKHCSRRKSETVNICLDASTGEGIVVAPVVLQNPSLIPAFARNQHCQTELPTIDLLQASPDPADLFRAILDVSSEFSGTKSGLVDVFHFCASNGVLGREENTNSMHGKDSLFSCSVRTTWPFNCGSNFIEYWVQVVDRRQSPPCVRNTGKRFSYCLDRARKVTLVLGMQEILFPPSLESISFGFQARSQGDDDGGSLRPCPSKTLFIDIIGGSLDLKDKNLKRILLEFSVDKADGFQATSSCQLNGQPGEVVKHTQLQRKAIFSCMVKPIFPNACGSNMVDLVVQSSNPGQGLHGCQQKGEIRASICSSPTGNDVYILEVLDVPRQRFGFQYVDLPQGIGENFLGVDLHEGKGVLDLSKFGGPGKFPWQQFAADWRSDTDHGLSREDLNQWHDWVPNTNHHDSKGGTKSNKQDLSWKRKQDFIRQSSTGGLRQYSGHDPWKYPWVGGHELVERPQCQSANDDVPEIRIQEVRVESLHLGNLLVDIALVEVDILPDKHPPPSVDCWLNGVKGTAGTPVKTSYGFNCMCNATMSDPYNCGGNEVQIIAYFNHWNNIQIPRECFPGKHRVFTTCLDPVTLEVIFSETIPAPHGANNLQELSGESAFGGYPWEKSTNVVQGTDEGCAIGGDVWVDISSQTWDKSSATARFQLLIRYERGAPPEKILQEKLSIIHVACSMHGKLGTASQPIASSGGLRVTCTIKVDWPGACGGNWLHIHVEAHENPSPGQYGQFTEFSDSVVGAPFHRQRNERCSKTAGRRVSFCVVDDGERPVILTSKIWKLSKDMEHGVCLVRSLSVKVVRLEEVSQIGFLPLLRAQVSVSIDFHPIAHRDWRDAHTLDPLRDIGCACQAGGVIGTLGSLKATEGGFEFTCTVPLHDRFDCLVTKVEFLVYLRPEFARMAGGSVECSETPYQATAPHCNKPSCKFHAIDMGYSRKTGLLTDSSSTRILFICTNPVEVCKECFTISGPQFPSIEHLQMGNEGVVSYHVYLSWEESYRGLVSISAETSRSRPGCSLALLGLESVLALHPECKRGDITKVGPVKDLTFSVVNQGQVLVKTLGYETLTQCARAC